MSSPDKAETRWKKIKNNVAAATTLAVIPAAGVGIRVLYSSVDVPASSEDLNVNRYNRGWLDLNIVKRGFRRNRLSLENGATVAGQMAGRTVAVYDIEPTFGYEHDGRAMVRYDGKLKKRRKEGRTVITVRGGKTMYVYNGERKAVGDTGIWVGYSQPRNIVKRVSAPSAS